MDANDIYHELSDFEKEPLDDYSPMPWGKYKGTEMIDVPDDYLKYMYDNNKVDTQVREYIEEYMNYNGKNNKR